MEKISKGFIDPKEKLVSHDTLEKYNKQLSEKTNSARGKHLPLSDDDDIR